jgi:hypothetical protein
MGTVHRTQGMILERALINLKANFWEHGQLDVVVSRVRQPDDLYILLLGSSNLDRETDPAEISICVLVNSEIAQIISLIYLSPICNGHVMLSGAESESIFKCTWLSKEFRIDPDDDSRASLAFPSDTNINDQDVHTDHHSIHDTVLDDLEIMFQDSIIQWSDGDCLAIPSSGSNHDTDF